MNITPKQRTDNFLKVGRALSKLSPSLLTGQQWYDKFMVELGLDKRQKALPYYRKVLEAARRAGGLE